MATSGEVVGEIGVLCYRPQLFTVRTRSLCQLLRLNRTAFLSIVQSNVGDGTIIMNNLIQVYHLFVGLFSVTFIAYVCICRKIFHIQSGNLTTETSSVVTPKSNHPGTCIILFNNM